MNKNTILTIVVILILIVLGFWWWNTYSVDETRDEVTENEMMAETEENAMMEDAGSKIMEGDAMMEDAGAMSPLMTGDSSITRDFSLTANNFKFSMGELRVKKGDKVTLTVMNSGGTHDWKLEGYNIGTKLLQAGQQETITFVANTTGSFEYYCSVGSHRAMGMKGTLIVE